ncbi:MAG: hypothetical protein ACMUIE_11010, partial [Thermoplasmatota archaeon]
MKRYESLALMMIVVLAVPLILPALAAPARPGKTRSGSEEMITLWDTDIAFQGTDPIDGIAIGDAVSSRDGNEMVWVARDGKTYLGYYDQASSSWTYDDIWSSPGQQLTPAIGDMRPDLPGNEILVVGLSSGTEDENPGEGTATVLSKSGAAWSSE